MSPWTCILIGALVTYLIRVLPLTLIRRPINNRFVKSFLYYVPYVTFNMNQYTTSKIISISEQTRDLISDIKTRLESIQNDCDKDDLDAEREYLEKYTQ